MIYEKFTSNNGYIDNNIGGGGELKPETSQIHGCIRQFFSSFSLFVRYRWSYWIMTFHRWKVFGVANCWNWYDGKVSLFAARTTQAGSLVYLGARASKNWVFTLQWCIMSVMASHPHLDYFLNCLFRHRSMKTSKIRTTGLWEGNPLTKDQ